MRAPLLLPSLPAPLRALALVVLVAVTGSGSGCAVFSPATLPATPIAVETATFTTDVPVQDVLVLGRRLARTYGMSAGFVDAGGGRFESDYVSLRSVQEALEDSLPGGPFLASTLVRFTLDATPNPTGAVGTAVRVRATMRPTSGAFYPQRTPGRYWLDRYAGTLAETLGAAYTPVVTDAQYLAVLDRGGDIRAPVAEKPRQGDLSRGLKIGGLVLVGAIAASILVGAF